MNTHLMKKAMIETAVRRGIREMEADPERSIRRLVDLGKQFSKNRFHDLIFTVMQECLDNENSAYYDMVRNALNNWDHDSMEKFGVNFGYMGWTYGAGCIREKEAQTGVSIPWDIMLRFDPDDRQGLTIQDLCHIIEEGQELGIYIYMIRQPRSLHDSYDILELLERYKDCAFIWIRDSGSLTAAQIQTLKVCRNTLVSLPADDNETLLTSELLRDQKVGYAYHTYYGDEDLKQCSSTDAFAAVREATLASETPFFLLVARDGTKGNAAQYAHDARLEQSFPCVVMDFYGDAENISHTIVDNDAVFEIGPDKKIVRPFSHAGEVFDPDRPLLDTFRDVFPPFQPAESEEKD